MPTEEEKNRPVSVNCVVAGWRTCLNLDHSEKSIRERKPLEATSALMSLKRSIKVVAECGAIKEEDITVHISDALLSIAAEQWELAERQIKTAAKKLAYQLTKRLPPYP